MELVLSDESTGIIWIAEHLRQWISGLAASGFHDEEEYDQARSHSQLEDAGLWSTTTVGKTGGRFTGRGCGNKKNKGGKDEFNIMARLSASYNNLGCGGVGMSGPVRMRSNSRPIRHLAWPKVDAAGLSGFRV